jgi:hypothetical protein
VLTTLIVFVLVAEMGSVYVVKHFLIPNPTAFFVLEIVPISTQVGLGYLYFIGKRFEPH